LSPKENGVQFAVATLLLLLQIISALIATFNNIIKYSDGRGCAPKHAVCCPRLIAWFRVRYLRTLCI